MTKKMFRKSAAVLCAAMLCGSAVCLTGCAGSQPIESGAPDTPAETIYSPVVPDSRVDENAPGEKLDGEIGGTIDYQEKLSVSLDSVIELDQVEKSEGRILIAELSITNKSTEAMDCSTLTHFSIRADGNDLPDAVRDLQAAVFARKYYARAAENKLESFNQKIQPNETLKGYVYLGAPSSWGSLELVYTPYMYYNTDTLVFTLDESRFTHYTGSLQD